MSYVRYSYMRCTCHSCLSYGVFRNSLVLFPHFFFLLSDWRIVWYWTRRSLGIQIANSLQISLCDLSILAATITIKTRPDSSMKRTRQSSSVVDPWCLKGYYVLITRHGEKKNVWSQQIFARYLRPGQSYLLYKILIDYWSSYCVLPLAVWNPAWENSKEVLLLSPYNS